MRGFALVVIIAALVGAPAGAGASSPIDVAGTWVVLDPGSETCAPNGSPFVFRCTVTGFVTAYSGGLTGTSVNEFVEIINCKTGRIHGHGTETFTGSVTGISGTGTLTWGIHFVAALDCQTFALSDFAGTGVGNAGSGALARLHTSLRFGDGTYEGELH